MLNLVTALPQRKYYPGTVPGVSFPVDGPEQLLAGGANTTQKDPSLVPLEEPKRPKTSGIKIEGLSRSETVNEHASLSMTSELCPLSGCSVMMCVCSHRTSAYSSSPSFGRGRSVGPILPAPRVEGLGCVPSAQ